MYLTMRRAVIILALLFPEIVGAGASGEGEATKNLVIKPGFEADGSWPDPWLSFSSDSSEAAAPMLEYHHNGLASMRVVTSGFADGYRGVIQFVPVDEKKKYSVSAFLRSDKNDALGGSAFVELVVEWRTEDGAEVGRDVGARKEARSLSSLRWQDIRLRALRAPEGAVKAVVGIHLLDGTAGGKGALLIDDVVFAESTR